MRLRVLPFVLLALACRTTPTTVVTTLAPGVLLDANGQLGEGDMRIGQAWSDSYEVSVLAGDAVAVEVATDAFDPMLEVTAPGADAIVNDDHEGDRTRSRVELVARETGTLKIRVTSYGPGASGSYRVSAQRAAPSEAAARGPSATPMTNVLVPGGTSAGVVDGADRALPDGRRYELVVVDVPENQAMTLRVSGGAEVVLRDPSGRYLNAPNGQAQLAHAGRYQVQIIAPQGATLAYRAELREDARTDGFRFPSLSRPHHRPPAASAPSTELALGQQQQATLQEGDLRLPSGELADVYRFEAEAGRELMVEMESDALDSYVMLFGPEGELWENDDHGGGLDSALDVRLPLAGTYHLVATSYRGDMSGAYRLKVFEPGPGPAVATPSGGPAGGELRGELQQGDRQLGSGEFYDEFDLAFEAGQRVSLALRSTDFDPYLIVQEPGGNQLDNDDANPGSGDLSAGLSWSVHHSGPHRVLVTSYQPGESGAYVLEVNGAAVAPTAAGSGAASGGAAGAGWDRTTGTLTRGDAQLPTGAFSDSVERQFTPGARVHVEARSGDFDTVLYVLSPSGETLENDDAHPGDLNSALDFLAEAGTYRLIVSSYRPGDTGAYELLTRGGDAATGGTAATGGIAATGGTAPAPTTAPPAPSGIQTFEGALEASDARLANGHFSDRHQLSLEAGAPASIRLTSDAFDTYLLVESPSGRHFENDDLASGTYNSGVDIPAAEAGVYRVTVTSYGDGETGAYQLLAGPGGTLPGPSPVGGTPLIPAGGQTYGIFVGISDYPGMGSDLPECANDAIKLAETLRERGLMGQPNQIVLTDAQATTGNVRQAFQQVARRLGPRDTFVFFYSGHGGREGGSQQALEIDGQDETLVLYDGTLLDDEMGRLFDGLNGRLSVLALDACYSGGFAKDVITRPGRIGLFSSEEDVLSSVASQFQAGGVLSHFLRVVLSGEADAAPRDSVLTAGELAHYMFIQFGTHVRDVNLAGAFQHLVVDRGAVSSDFPVFAYE